MIVFQTFLVCNNGFEEYYTDILQNFPLSGFFSWFDCTSIFLGGRPQRKTSVGLRFKYITSRVHTINRTYHYLCWPYSPDWGGFVRFLHCNVIFLLFSCYFWKEDTNHRPYLWNVEISSISLGVEYLYKLFGRIFVFSPSFIYSIICIYWYENTNIYFIYWVIV